MENHGIGTPSAPAVDAPPRSGAAARFRRRRNAWAAAAVALAIGGSLGATFAARGVAHHDAMRSHDAFEVSSAEVASTLQLALLHEEDLVVSAQAFFVGNPGATNTEFARWATAVDAFDRYPELLGFGFSEVVRGSELPAFAKRIAGDPPGPLGPGGTLRVTPPGKRPFYCLVPISMARDAATEPPVGLDYCAGPAGRHWLTARDTGRATYAPITLGKVTSLAIGVPVYRDGTVPSTVRGRRAASLGQVGMGVVPQMLLDRALEGHPGTVASMRFHRGGSDVTFATGKPPDGAHRDSHDLGNGWTVQTFGVVADSGVLANAGASSLLGAGVAASLLLAIVMFLLGTGRARAWRLVNDKTDELRHQALHDPLTGLPNRALVVDRAEQMLARNRRAGTEGAALFLDLDEFKLINDTLGHQAGDDLLRAVAQRLEACLRESDTIGRMGGDEFVILTDGGVMDVAPELVAGRVLDVLRQPFALVGTTMPVTVSVSIGIATGDRSSPGELLRDADIAMYLAKGAGRNRFEVFGPEMEVDVRHRYEMEFELRAALDAGQFRLVYQPIYRLDELSVIGAEALLRWDHPTLGAVPPDEFIPLLEANGHIREVGRMVLNEACQQMARWHADGSTLGLSVNVSARQLDDDEIVEHVREALELSGLAAEVLTLEVTETALMRNADVTAQRLRELKTLGIQLAIDDFGTGYSSLAYLQKFPVDSLKIDRTFIDGISRSPESKALIHTLVRLGRDLGLRTLAEGVETTEQVDDLRGQHVDEAQGFLLARPLDPEIFASTILHPLIGPVERA